MERLTGVVEMDIGASGKKEVWGGNEEREGSGVEEKNIIAILNLIQLESEKLKRKSKNEKGPATTWIKGGERLKVKKKTGSLAGSGRGGCDEKSGGWTARAKWKNGKKGKYQRKNFLGRFLLKTTGGEG